MAQYGEYSGPAVNGCGSSYTTLGHYNKTSAGSMTSPPISPTVTSGIYVVPSYGASSGPLSLTAQCAKQADGSCVYTPGGVPTSNGFFTIESAYGKGAANCGTQYTSLSCGGTKTRRS